MATSERVVTALADAPGVHPPTAKALLRSPARAVWRQVVLDFIILSLGLAFARAALSGRFGAHSPPFSYPSAIAVATMLTTILAFSGTDE